jgi:hypothetical protein
MKTPNALNLKLRLGLVVLMFLAAFPLQANPIPIGIHEKPVTPEITFLITIPILLEAICWVFLLRRFQRPRLFILWILGMHLLTFPAFLSFLWLLQDMRPALAVAFGESLVVLVEGILIYLICRYVPTRQKFSTASLFRCWLVSLAGNACSLIAFPFLTHLYDFVFGGG